MDSSEVTNLTMKSSVLITVTVLETVEAVVAPYGHVWNKTIAVTGPASSVKEPWQVEMERPEQDPATGLSEALVATAVNNLESEPAGHQLEVINGNYEIINRL